MFKQPFCCSILILAVVSIFFYSCTNKYKNNTAQVFCYNEFTGINSLDPALAKNQSIIWPVHQLYNTLVEVDSSMQIVPSLAKQWTFSNNNKTIQFLLRNDVYFHDNKCFEKGIGRRLTAYDVVYSFERLVTPKTASPGAWIFNNRIDSSKPFAAINDSIFVLNLSEPFVPILGILSMAYCSIVPHEAVTYYGNTFRANPVGTGAFVFVNWQEGEALVLKKNNNYFERDEAGNRLPYLQGIKISFLNSKASEFLAFRQKKIDFINDIDPAFKDEVLTKTGKLKSKWESIMTMHSGPYLNTEYLGILMDSTKPIMQHSPLNNIWVRKAINYGINRSKMILYMRNSIGTPATAGFVPPGLPSFDSTKVIGYNYNVDTAKKLLQRAGYNKQNPMPTITLVTIPNYANLAVFIANDLAQIGITLQVEVMQKSTLIDLAGKNEVAFFRGSWIADYPDAENYLSVFYSPNPSPPNYTRYKNKAYDDLYIKAVKDTNIATRYTTYQAMDNMMLKDAPIIPLWYDKTLHLVQKNIENFYPNPLNLLELRRVKKL